jgi:uncharacterized membrane protein required for colicin V production
MQLTSFVFFCVLAFFVWRGYQKGIIGSIARLLSWIVAYPATLIFTPSVASLLIQHTPLNGMIVYFIAGAGTFLVVSFAVELLITTCGNFTSENESNQTSSKIGGAGIGAFVGTIAGLVVVYAMGIALAPTTTPVANNGAVENTSLHNLQGSNTDNNHPPVPALRDLSTANDSFIEASAKKLMGAAASMAVDLVVEDKTVSQVTKAFVKDPQVMLGHVQQITHNGQLQTLLTDEKIQSILTAGDTQRLVQAPEFKALIANPSMQALMVQSEVNTEAGAQAAAEKMVFAWNRVQLIKHDPRVMAIINDPEFQQQLNSSNKLPLMMNPKLNELTQIIFDPNSSAATNSGRYEVIEQKNNQAGEGTGDKTSTQVYRWADEKGQVHFSDKPANPLTKDAENKAE